MNSSLSQTAWLHNVVSTVIGIGLAILAGAMRGEPGVMAITALSAAIGFFLLSRSKGPGAIQPLDAFRIDLLDIMVVACAVILLAWPDKLESLSWLYIATAMCSGTRLKRTLDRGASLS